MNDSSQIEYACPVEDVAAYLDGELTGAANETLEAHLAECVTCATELRTQQQLLCTLDAAFKSSPRLRLPANFTRVVAAHAEGDLRGVRNKTERRRAFQLCAMLSLAAFALLGAASGAVIWQPVRGWAQLIARVSDLLWQTGYDAAIGIGVILRMIGRAAVVSPYGLGSFVVLAFLIAISLLPRLIANYHRTEIIE
jgi:anti-sigma factor RsiW